MKLMIKISKYVLLLLIFIGTIPVIVNSSSHCPDICRILIRTKILVHPSMNNPSYINSKIQHIQTMVQNTNNNFRDSSCIEFYLDGSPTPLILPASGPGYTTQPPTSSDPNSYLVVDNPTALLMSSYNVNPPFNPSPGGAKLVDLKSQIYPPTDYEPITVFFSDKVSILGGDSYTLSLGTRTPTGSTDKGYVIVTLSFFPDPPNPAIAEINHIPHEIAHVAKDKNNLNGGAIFNDHVQNPDGTPFLFPNIMTAHAPGSNVMTPQQRDFMRSLLCHTFVPPYIPPVITADNLNVAGPTGPGSCTGNICTYEPPTQNICGNNILEPPEECEPPNPDNCFENMFCNSQCQWEEEVCGNGIVHCQEICDPPGSLCPGYTTWDPHICSNNCKSCDSLFEPKGL